MSWISTGDLPGGDEIERLLSEAHRAVVDLDEGEVADYIPALARVSPDLFGICLYGVSGRKYAIGDTEVPFTIQSVSKPFVFALVCEMVGAEAARTALGVNSTGMAFNSVVAVEIHPDHVANPMVNAGAIATTSMVRGSTPEEKWDVIRSGLSRFAGRELLLDHEVYQSESSSNHRNLAIARLLAWHGRLSSDPDEATDLYTRQCSLLITAEDLALMGATLADGGTNPLTGDQVVSAETCRRVLAVMATAGLYETSGDWLYDVGIPGQSGVSGGIVTIAPGKGGCATFSPRLDGAGNSVRGREATIFLSEELGLNLFASQPEQPS